MIPDILFDAVAEIQDYVANNPKALTKENRKHLDRLVQDMEALRRKLDAELPEEGSR